MSNSLRNNHTNDGGVMIQRQMATPSTSSLHNSYQLKPTRSHNSITADTPSKNNSHQPEAMNTTPALSAPANRFFGMENFGNTCYCNSVLQCLYYTKPFRDQVLDFVKNEARPKKLSVPGKTPHPFTVDPASATLLTSASQPSSGMDSNTTSTASTTSGLSGLSLGLKSQEALNNNGNSSNNNGKLSRRLSLFGKKKDKEEDQSQGLSVPGSAGGPSSSVGSVGSVGGSSASPVANMAISAPPAPGYINDAQPAMGILRAKPNYPGLEGIPLGHRLPNYNVPVVGYTEDPFATPESKKRAALVTGPIINLDHSFAQDYNMKESLFTALKDIFECMSENSSRIGIMSPSNLITVLKRENELFRSSMHQDAHEFLNFLLNEVIESVDGASPSKENSKWIHELFEGSLTSETKCLTCETVSRRHESFLDLSIDLERNSSVTSCLRQFSASEMLCERNKFYCDTCCGLQEAEKRMKIQKLPKVLALHLKRFKFTEDMQRNTKLFHRVAYPKYLRMFETTFDCPDPDKLYELYAVVVHIGGGPYHGHYVSVIKTESAGWLLFDDEMVEAVDPNYVFNFFGDNRGLASAYVLFYQETTLSQMESDNLANDVFNVAPNSNGDLVEHTSSTESVPLPTSSLPNVREDDEDGPVPSRTITTGFGSTTGLSSGIESVVSSATGSTSNIPFGTPTAMDMSHQPPYVVSPQHGFPQQASQASPVPSLTSSVMGNPTMSSSVPGSASMHSDLSSSVHSTANTSLSVPISINESGGPPSSSGNKFWQRRDRSVSSTSTDSAGKKSRFSFGRKK